jgi:acetyl-CoA acetyltransferase
MIVASEDATVRYELRARARIPGMATAVVPPRLMGIGPGPATRKLLTRLGKPIADFVWIQ